MNYFHEFPPNHVCPVYGTNKPGDLILIPDILTQEGNICEAKAVHVDCIQEHFYSG